MSYIAYFDLVGTKGFCESPEVYFEKMQHFKKAIEQISWLVREYGTVGVFSDCAYVESSDLKCILDFLVQLRDRLISKGLFFNAVVKSGSLDPQDLKAKGSQHLFGVAFNNSSIADLYIQQTKFKGLGILIDRSIQEEVKETAYTMTDCIFIERRVINNCIEYIPTSYKDISFGCSIKSKKSIEILLRMVLNVMFTSYIKSPKYGTYYVSILSNLVRSYTQGFEWDMKKQKFTSMPLGFQSVNKILSLYYDKMTDLSGLEYLAFVLLDVIYNSQDLNDEEKSSITNSFSNYECIKKYLHSLNSIPENIFTGNNRNLFIKYCQDDLSSDFVEKVLDNNQ